MHELTTRRQNLAKLRKCATAAVLHSLQKRTCVNWGMAGSGLSTFVCAAALVSGAIAWKATLGAATERLTLLESAASQAAQREREWSDCARRERTHAERLAEQARTARAAACKAEKDAAAAALSLEKLHAKLEAGQARERKAAEEVGLLREQLRLHETKIQQSSTSQLNQRNYVCRALMCARSRVSQASPAACFAMQVVTRAGEQVDAHASRVIASSLHSINYSPGRKWGV